MKAKVLADFQICITVPLKEHLLNIHRKKNRCSFKMDKQTDSKLHSKATNNFKKEESSVYN